MPISPPASTKSDSGGVVVKSTQIQTQINSNVTSTVTVTSNSSQQTEPPTSHSTPDTSSSEKPPPVENSAVLGTASNRKKLIFKEVEYKSDTENEEGGWETDQGGD